ncbi:MAG TPA: serine/threonine-protein kinase, partial [Gemmataceae bacterium]|nr:serine/threonine-protein kinase [Gemmataceae bacterium]
YRPGNEDAPAAASVRPGSASFDLPARFGRYRLEKELGKGGMGAVYLAYDTQLDRHVALKVPTFGQDEGGRRERFFQEARAAATLNHPNLCPVFDIGELDGVCYLTMAYIDGKPLSDYIRADRPFLPATAAVLVRVLAKALQEAHDHGIIHRDLKPSNILINRKKAPIITDFGLARRASSQDERLTHSGELMGTPAYMPPEQVNGDVAAMGPGCDIYSLGVILYELLANRRPFQGAVGMLMAKIVMDPPPPPSQFRPELDPALEAICLRALAKRPEDRYPSMRAFAEALEAWLAGKASASAGPDSSRPLAANTERLALLDEPATDTATATPRPTISARRIKKRSGRPFHLTRGQVWMILAGMLLFTTCVLPVTCVSVLVYHTVNKVSDGAKEAGQLFRDLKKDQDRPLQEREKEQQQWQEVARTWQAPPSNAALERLFPAAVGEHRRIEQDDQALATDLNVSAPGRRAVYRDSIATVELFVYRAPKPDKEVILRKVQQAVTRRNAASGLMQANPHVRGSAEGMFLSYDLEPSGAGAEQHGTFWWQQGWLFLARSGNPQAAGLFLKEYLTAISHN